MALETYRRKRDFAATPEPKGAATPRKRRRTLRFVVQKHAARRLHYDLRLEVEGVLWSWAVTRGPSLVPSDKRLAVRTEDHPLDYGGFEGTIPKGEYGGGTVLVWDRGDWTPLADPAKGEAKGHIEFELKGARLKGRWRLVRLARKPREKRDNWLLIKGEDAHARAPEDPDVLEEHPGSVKTGRDLEEVAREAPGWSSRTGRIAKAAEKAPAATPAKPPAAKGRARPAVKGAIRGPFPGFVPPALATLRPEPPKGARWLHEIKFDGYRLQAHLRAGVVTLLTRNGHDWTDRFGPRIREALAALPAEEAILDGELVVERGGGASDFSALQADLAEGRCDRFVYYAFDLIHLDGRDLRAAPLVARKSALEALVAQAPAALRFSGHFQEEGEIILRHACRLSLEGVVSKLRDGKYRSGRGKGWIKSKCLQRQEFVVAGYIPSTTARKAVGALVLGAYDDAGALLPAGRVGTGFTQRAAEDLMARLEPLRREAPAFAARLDAATRREARLVAPELVAEVEFLAWTAEGSVRHAAFRGLREDKPAAEIRREPAPAPDAAGDKPAPGQTGDKPAPGATGDKPPAFPLTHPDRLYWKDAGVTKLGLATYYAQVWRHVAPHLVNRPLALLRCPRDIDATCFFQKHAWRGQSREILRAADPLDTGADPSLIAINDLPGLIGLVQGAALEIHTWQSTLDDLERPDQIVMDLDPGPGVAWEAVIAGAREVRDRLAEAGLASFVKTSGGKGFHVVAPLAPAAGWAAVKGFAKGIAERMAADSPERFTAVISKARRPGRILIDYLRNGRGATAIAPYASRARAGAAVSMPLDWGEIDSGLGADHFTVANAATRLASLDADSGADPWADFRAAARPLPAG